MLHLIAPASLLVSLVSAEAASQPPEKSLLAFNESGVIRADDLDHSALVH
jgi:hypothetical protein